MSARKWISIAAVALSISTVACSREKKTDEVSHPGNVQQDQTKTAPDCSNFMGAWQLESPIQDQGVEVSELFFIKDQGSIALKMNGLDTEYVIDGDAHVSSGKSVAGECTANGMLWVKHEEINQMVSPSMRFVFVWNGDNSANLVVQQWGVDPADQQQKFIDVSSTAMTKEPALSDKPVSQDPSAQ